MKSEMSAWEETETPMEMDEDRLHNELQENLLEEVSLSFPHVGIAGNPSASTPIPISVPTPVPILRESSTSVLPESADQRMKDKLDKLRESVREGRQVSGGFDTPFSFSTPASATLPYPGLDGHPRRIIPSPISVASPQPAFTVGKSPEEIRGGVDELIQKLESEKK